MAWWSFQDLPLWAKVLVAPAAGIASGIAVAASIWLGATETESRLAAVATVTLPTAEASARLLDRADRIQATAMRAMILQQSGVPEATIDALGKQVNADLATLRTDASAMLQGRGDGDAELPRLKSIAENARAYGQQLGDALDLVTDPPIAIGYFRRADATFESLRDTLFALANAHRSAEAQSIQAARDSSRASLTRFYWIFSVSTAVMMIVLPCAIAAIARPVRALTRTMTQLASGDLEAEAAGQEHRDELGDMARSVHVFRQNAIAARRQTQQREAAQAAKERHQAALAEATAAFGRTVGGVLASLEGSGMTMRRAADELATAAGHVKEQAGGTASNAEDASRDLTGVSAAAAELAGSVAAIADQVAAASEVVREAVHRADASNAKIGSLTDATARIGDVVQLINDIAGRTSLLALNATIEAARAGEAGKGFAVVAGEVKALAAQTAQATQEIATQIATIRVATDEAVIAIEEVGRSIGRMDAVTGTIAAAVEQQGGTTRQIARSVETVSGATLETTEAMRRLTGVADHAATLSDAVLEAAARVAREADTMRAEVDRFLGVTRTEGGVAKLAA